MSTPERYAYTEADVERVKQARTMRAAIRLLMSFGLSEHSARTTAGFIRQPERWRDVQP